MNVTDDRDRFEQVFHAHYAAIVRYATRRVGPDAAQEVVADTFLTAWRRRSELPAQNPLPWLYAVARRTVANEVRRTRRVTRLRTRLVDAPPPDQLDSHVEAMHVRAALARLSDVDREALLLVEWEQLSSAEAAQVLGCRVGTFHVRLHRARRRIAVLLRDADDSAREPNGANR